MKTTDEHVVEQGPLAVPPWRDEPLRGTAKASGLAGSLSGLAEAQPLRAAASPSRTPVENWWTPERVRLFLARYREMAEVLDGYGRDCGRLYKGSLPDGTTEPLWISLVHIKADLDRAMAALPARQRQVARMYWVEGYDQWDIAAECGTSQQRASSMVGAALQTVTGFLGVGVV